MINSIFQKEKNMTKKYLAGNGKMYTLNQLDKLNMKQVFDHLISLGVADKTLYQDFKAEQDDYSPPRRRRSYSRRKRSYSRRSPRYRVIYRAKSRSPRYRVIYGKQFPIRSGQSPTLTRNRLRQLAGPGPVMRRTIPKKLPSRGTGRCERMGLITCPDTQCATKRSNCN